MDDLYEPQSSSTCNNSQFADQEILLQTLLKKIQPLLDGGRIDNIIEVLALISDMVDIVDAAMVEKLARLFEEGAAVSWSFGNALRMAKSITTAEETPPSFYGLMSLLRQKDTRRGIALILRTLNVLGRQL